MTDESSSEELTRDTSNLSVSSNASTKVSDSDEGKYSGDEFEEGEAAPLSKESTSTSLESTSSSSSSSSSIVNNQHDETIKRNLSERDSDHEETVNEGKKGVISRENTNVSTSSEDISNKKSSRENTNVSIKLTSSDDEGTDDGNQVIPSRENTNISVTSSDDGNKTKLSRENTNISVTSSDDGNQAKPSRENTNISKTNDDGNQTDSKYEDDFNDDDKSSRESSFMSNSSNNSSKSESTVDGSDEELKLDKEDSVLIERDGKFELVDPNELKMEYFNLLGLPEEKPKKKPSSAPQSREKVEVPQRNSHSSLSKSAYAHIQSSYAMSGQQKEMKKRRINLIKVRKDEEKEKQKEEEKQRRIAAEKSFKVLFVCFESLIKRIKSKPCLLFMPTFSFFFQVLSF